MLELREGVVVFAPERAAEALELARASSRGRELEPPRVAFAKAEWRRYDDVFADAYASTEQMLEEAIAFARAEDRAQRALGPRRVVYVGAIGDGPTRVAIGKTIVLGPQPIFLGRQESCDFCLRQGGHSDQNTLARLNTRIVLVGNRVGVADMGSTNGTWFRDGEICVGYGQRLRVEGAKG